MNLSKFTATKEEVATIRKNFTLYQVKLDFRGKPVYHPAIPETNGVYFIAGLRNCDLLKAYVGKATKGFKRRLDDYHREFQAHSPNDAKMIFFQEWLEEKDPGWELHLYYRELGIKKSPPKRPTGLTN